MNNMPCRVIEDLLPLYVDKACSEESCLLVEQHLVSCDYCRKQLEEMKGTVVIPPVAEEEQRVQDERAIQLLAKAWHKTKWFAWVKGLVAAGVIFASVILGYIWLSEWKLVEIPSTSFEVSELYQLSDGTISYRLKATDGYEVRSLKFTVDDEGDAYVVGHRAVISNKIDVNLEIGRSANSIHQFNPNMQTVFSFNSKRELIPQPKITKLYYGTKESNFLIWQEGMELPKASAELEEYWHNHNARIDEQLNIEIENNK